MSTTLTPWTGNNLLGDFRHEMDELMNRFFHREGTSNGSGYDFVPSLNLAETTDGYEVSLDVPGIAADDLNVEVRNGELWITGERKSESEEQDKSYHRVESHYGKFQRMVRLGSDVDAEKVDAEYTNGVLKISVPKSETSKPKHVEVKKN